MSLKDFGTQLQSKLEPWVNNPPDYNEMKSAYLTQGRFKSAIRLKKREIEREEDTITGEQDRPRSNEAKKAKLLATSALKDQLAQLEADLEVIESEIKALEFMKVMFNAANYRTRLSMDFN